jgi:hypothetical protein
MEYVHVVSNLISNSKYTDFEIAAINQSKNILISLIHGLRQNQFGHDTMDKLATKINEIVSIYKEKLPDFKSLFIDSGGYSVITGDVKFYETDKFIYCYLNFLKNRNRDYDFIFSLDIPLWGSDIEKNTRQNIYQYNLTSLSKSKDILLLNQEISSKFYFVWQFVNKYQFSIWNDLYDSLDLNNVVKNRAIGGLVSLISRSNIDFSPFTEIAIRCFLDHINSPFSEDEFKLHVLGQNRPYHRFQIQLLESLFQAYIGREASLTYDSANYTISALYNVKNLDVFYVEEKKLIHAKKVHHLPEHIIRKIFITDEIYTAFKQYIQEMDSGDKLTDPCIGIPVNVFSQLQLDKYFMQIIDESQIVDKILTNNPASFSLSMNQFLTRYEKIFEYIYGANQTIVAQNDLSRTYKAFQILKHNSENYFKAKELINQAVYSVIEDIGVAAI